MTLEGKIAFITGAAHGSGRALALALAARGARVAANDITPIHADPLVEEILAHGGEARAYIQDISKKMPAQTLINRVTDDYGRIEILINHAAVEPKKAILDIDEWDWLRTLTVNLTGAFLMTQSVGRVMREQGSGLILNLIPLYGHRQADEKAAYAASMMGLVEFTRHAARELSPYGLRVYAVSSGIPREADARFDATIPDLALRLCEGEAAEGVILNAE